MGDLRIDTDSVGGNRYRYDPITAEALRLVFGDRGHDYGHPAEDFGRTARLWSLWLGHDLDAEDVAAMMVLLKLSRQFNAAKRDNLVDACGYLECWQRILDARREGAIG